MQSWYILKVYGIFIGLIKVFIEFDRKKFPSLVYEKFEVEYWENQKEVNLSAKKAGNSL